MLGSSTVEGGFASILAVGVAGEERLLGLRPLHFSDLDSREDRAQLTSLVHDCRRGGDSERMSDLYKSVVFPRGPVSALRRIETRKRKETIPQIQ